MVFVILHEAIILQMLSIHIQKPAPAVEHVIFQRASKHRAIPKYHYPLALPPILHKIPLIDVLIQVNQFASTMHFAILKVSPVLKSVILFIAALAMWNTVLKLSFVEVTIPQTVSPWSIELTLYEIAFSTVSHAPRKLSKAIDAGPVTISASVSIIIMEQDYSIC